MTGVPIEVRESNGLPFPDMLTTLRTMPSMVTLLLGVRRNPPPMTKSDAEVPLGDMSGLLLERSMPSSPTPARLGITGIRTPAFNRIMALEPLVLTPFVVTLSEFRMISPLKLTFPFWRGLVRAYPNNTSKSDVLVVNGVFGD